MLNRKWLVGRNGEIYHYQFFDPAPPRAERAVGVPFDPKTHALTERVYATQATYTPARG